MRPGTIGAAVIAGVLISGLLALLIPRPLLSQAGGRAQQSVDDFETVAKVLGSPRCQNCHTLTNVPRQGDDRHAHLFNVARGGADRGAPGLPCSTCHGQSNNTASGVPGALEAWRLAPVSMGWEGLSTIDLCQHLKDPRRNGHRNGADIIDHLKSPLVMWSWAPGSDPHGHPRNPPPIAYPDFIKAAESWVRTGAACPRP
jgi:hypothetical protein